MRRHGAPLLRLVLLLEAWARAFGPVMPRRARNALARLLRPAESTARRLVWLQLRLREAAGAAPALAAEVTPPRRAKRESRRRSKGLPLIDGLWGPQREACPPCLRGVPVCPLAPVPTAPLLARVGALRAALSDLDAPADRLARWEARQRALLARGRPSRRSSLRTWRPPARLARTPPRRGPMRRLQALLLDTHALTRRPP